MRRSTILVGLAGATLAVAGGAPTPGPSGPPAFGGWRPAATDAGTLQLSLQQLQGEPLRSARVHSRAERDGGAREADAPAEVGGGGAVTAELAAPPAGTASRAWLTGTSADGRPVRAPARREAAFEVRVPPLDVLEVDSSRLRLRVRSAATPQGEAKVVLRTPGAPPSASAAPLGPCGEAVTGEERCLEAPLPRLDAGTVLEWWFQLRLPGGGEVRVPEGAPAQAFRRTVSPVQVRPVLEVLAPPTAVEARGAEAWIGSRGGGVWLGQAGTPGRALSLGGMPSGMVSFIADDPPGQRTYVGTDRGLVVLAAGQPPRRVDPPPDLAACQGLPCRAGPGAVSPLDGTLLFQLEPAPEATAMGGHPAVLELRDGLLRRWDPKLPGGRLAGVWSLQFDVRDGCFLAGANLESAGGAVHPAALRRCGDAVEEITLRPGEGAQAPRRISALAPDPGGGVIAAVEWTGPRGDVRSELWSELAPSRPRLDAPVTALAPDWRRRRVLVASAGAGLWEVRDGSAKPIAAPELGATVTALQLAPDQDRALVGTAAGAFWLDLAGGTARPVGPTQGLPPDALPTDVERSGARVLLSSPSSGLVELSRSTSGWSVSRRWQPGRELPAGIFGDAQYAGPAVAVILAGQGVAVVRDGRVTRLESARGWPRKSPLRLLAAAGGGFWVAFEPLPYGEDSGGGVALVREGAVERMIPLPDRALATISRWIELPERRGLLAATRAGALEIRRDGSTRLRSNHPASSVAQQPGHKVVAVVGSAVERSEDDRFRPVLFRLDSAEPGFKGPPGDPIDVAIGANGCWYVLYARGVLAILDPAEGARATLTPSDGVPPSARRLLAVPGRSELLIGSTVEGPFSLSDPGTCARSR